MCVCIFMYTRRVGSTWLYQSSSHRSLNLKETLNSV